MEENRSRNEKIMDCVIAEWELERYRDDIEHGWRNLLGSEAFSDKNSFQTLALALKFIDKNFVTIFGIHEYIGWIVSCENPTKEQLKAAADKSRMFQHVLSWNRRLNGYRKENREETA